MLKLRDYQQEAVAGVRSLLLAGVNRPAVVKATGLGKTTDFAHLIHQHLIEHPRERALVIVHRNELATQARDRIHQQAPHLRPGIVMDSQTDHDRPVVVASVQTLSRGRMRDGITTYPRRDQIHSVGLTIVDECHHAAADSYRSVLGHFGAWNGVPTVGFTATMTREDKRGLGEIWQQVVERPGGGVWDTEWGIRNGWLCDVRGIRVKVPSLDLSGVHIRAGDLQQEETAAAMMDANTGEAIAKAIHEFAGDRRSIVVYCPNVETSYEFARVMNAAGIPTGTVVGATPKQERAEIYKQYRTGQLRAITNAMVLTEGWDAPWTDCIIIARPTRSSGLYQQMVGRGLRTFADKQDCLVLDVCGVTDLHGLASLTDLSMDRKVKPKDGQSLLEALDEFDLMDVEWQDNEPFYSPIPPVHKVIGTEIDMFGNSHSVWLKTRAGTWFIPAGDQLFFLWPNDDGLFNLGRTPKTRAEQAVLLREDPADLSIAMALLEQYASEYAPDTAGKNAPWRQTGRATTGQKRDLAVWHVPVKRNMTSAQAYDAINVAIASRRLDFG